ncbi:MAG: glycosyltransferase [Victivallales bacterium]|jgi:glycosyltransferase involved in cell wall biosynthesis|nr:glycosyltransferase [Victivallales bacterium]
MSRDFAVTVILPTYNRADILPRAIRCIVDQTFQDWQLIVANDGGEDVGSIVESFQDPRIHYLNLEHRGKGATLNSALKEVSTEFIAYMDDDDELFPEHLETLYRVAKEKKSGFVFSDTWRTCVDKTTGKVLNEVVENDMDATPEMLRVKNYINHKQILHSKALADAVGGYDEELPILIDYDFIRRIALLEAPIHVRKITGRHYLLMEGREVTSITGLWTRNPELCGKALLRIFGKNPADMMFMYKNGVSAIDRIEKLSREKKVIPPHPILSPPRNALQRLAMFYADHGFRQTVRRIINEFL